MVKEILISLILVVLTVNIGKGQDERIFHFGLNITPKLTKQYFENSELGKGNTLFGLSVGFDVYYDISNKIELKSGVNYSYNQINQIDYSPIFECDLDFMGGRFDEFNSWYKDKYQISYLGIPIESKLKILGEENHLYTKLGIETLFKVGQKTKSFIVECGTHEWELQKNINNEPRDVIFKSKFGVGYEFKAGKKMKLYIEPQLEYSINGIFKESGLVSDLTNNNRLLDIGIMIGTRI